LGELPPVFDLESNQTPPYPPAGAKVTVVDNVTLSKRSREWLRTVQNKTNRVPIMYTRARFWNDFMKDKTGQYPDWAPQMRLWTAHYCFPDRAPKPDELEWFVPKVAVPKSWDTWDFWQYTDDALLDGITNKDNRPSKIDLNLFNGTVDELQFYSEQVIAGAITTDVAFAVSYQGDLTYPEGTNQEVVHAFSRAFGPGFWDVLSEAGLTSLTENSDQRYHGPAIEEMPIDEVAQAKLKDALIGVL
jgi:hypothetical protein